MEENTDGKKKTSPSIPANYISILQLQERWINEKEKKRKEEEEERRRKQQVEEEKKIEEEDLKKAEEARAQMEEEKRLNRSHRKHWGRKKESMNSGEAKSVEKEKPEVTAAIGSGGGEDTAEGLPKKDRGFRRKRYKSKKKKEKKNQDVDVVEDVVDCGCGSIAPPDYVVTENTTPVKDVNRVYRKEGEEAATGNKSVATDHVMAIETQFEDLSIERGETKNLKSSNRNWPKQKQKLDSQRDRLSIGAASTMVWVKKEKNERAGDGIASGVKRSY